MTLEELRIKRHLAAFLGDCGMINCAVCAPRREPDTRPAWMKWTADHKAAKELAR